MKRDPKRLYPTEHVQVYPWSATGPGWANQGIDLLGPDEKSTSIYVGQLGPLASVLFPVALAAVGALMRALAYEGYARKRP